MLTTGQSPSVMLTNRSKKDRSSNEWNTRGDFTMETQAYCVKCRKTQTVENATVKEAANGRRMAQGICPVCGTKVTRFLPNEKKA
jgi:hypothetical protein